MGGRVLCASFLLPLLAACSASHRLSSQLDGMLATPPGRPFNGVVLISQDDQVVYTQALGQADPERAVPLKLEDRFVIGSLSKQMTATLVLREAEAGRLHLDAPIGHYLRLDADWARTVKVRHLLNHTSGIASFGAPLKTEAGTTFAYSNLGYDLLGQIVEHTSRRTLDTLLAELFAQCGMSQSGTLASEARQPVTGYMEETDGRLAAASLLEHSRHTASGAVVSTAGDLMRWNACLHSGRLLSAPSYQAMTSPSASREHRWGRLGYGYGVQISHPRGVLEFSHSGYVPGFIATMTYYPQSRLSLVVLENVSWRAEDMLRVFAPHDAIRHQVLDVSGEPPPHPERVSSRAESR